MQTIEIILIAHTTDPEIQEVTRILAMVPATHQQEVLLILTTDQ